MNLKFRTTKVRAVFEYVTSDMKASFELRPGDSPEELIAKLEKLLAFLRREQPASERPAGLILPDAPGYVSAPAMKPLPGPWVPPVGSASGPGTLMQQGLQQAKQFTGVPPVQPIPLQDSINRLPSGWELMKDDD